MLSVILAFENVLGDLASLPSPNLPGSEEENRVTMVSRQHGEERMEAARIAPGKGVE